jgi:hypothetical protein
MFFLQYAGLKEIFEIMMESENKTLFSDILSVLGMTMAGSGSRESLKYKLNGAKGSNLDMWGFEYVKNCELSAEWCFAVSLVARVCASSH